MLVGKQFGRYEVRERVGAGGMGEVYLAHDPELDRAVALKILSAEFLVDEGRQSRFRQEARAASALNHPNIITIYEIGKSDGGSFLATEFIDGETLRGFIKHKSLSVIQILKIIEQVANALVAAHAAHIVHRDIKPENIMVRRDSIVKVLDFGLAKPIFPEFADEKSCDSLLKTLPGMVMGSVCYMSPEQARGLPVDERTDIWSLGVVLYEMLTGQAPFGGATPGDTIAAVLCKEPVSMLYFIPDAPAELQRIIRKTLQKDREERYQNVKDFRLDVKDLIHELEHTTSGERVRHISGELDLSESPTMIHQTNSANHRTHGVHRITRGTGNYAASGKRKGWQIGLVSLAAVAVFAALGLAFYGRFASPPQVAAVSLFDKLQVSSIGTNGKAAAPTISPDGKYVAYLSGEVGNRSLVVRQISTDSLVTIVPPTALTLSGISFSPDGDYVYFLQMSEDFVINTLYRVPTLGGTPKKLIEDVDSVVTFSPDGKQLAFQRNIPKEGIVIIYTAAIDGANVQPLIRSDETDFNMIGNPKWSPSGSTILVRAFNDFGGAVEKMEFAEISVAEKKLKTFASRQWHQVDNFCWLKDNSGFLFTGQETPNSPNQIWRATYPDGEFYHVTNDTNNYNSLGLSADGKTIITLKSSASSSIWNYNPATKQATQITAESQNQEGSFGLAQMPDGKIVHTRKNGNDISLWLMNADTSNARQLLTEIKGIYNPKITPDNRYIVFGSKQSGTARIWRMDADGKNLIQLTAEKSNYGDFNPQLTPDGKTIIYHEFATGATGETAFMKVSIDGGESSVMYKDPQFSIFNQMLSPDGKYIAYNSIYKANHDKKIRIAALENNAFGKLVKEFDADSINSYLWSPDGKSLTFLSNQSGVPNLWRLSIGGSAPQPLTDFKSGRIFNYVWSTDNKNLFIVRGNVQSDLILIRDN